MFSTGNKSLCLEGNAGCGKTTIGLRLANFYGGLFIPEYTETMDFKDTSFLMNSFKNNEKINSYCVWKKAELKRLKLILEAGKNEIIMDTSLISIICFELARFKLSHSENIKPLLSGYIKLLKNDEVFLPSKMIFLYAHEKERIKRISIRGNCHPFLCRSDVAEYLTQLRVEFAENYMPKNSWCIIDTTNLSTEEVFSRVLELSSSLEEVNLNKFFYDWLIFIREGIDSSSRRQRPEATGQP